MYLRTCVRVYPRTAYCVLRNEEDEENDSDDHECDTQTVRGGIRELENLREGGAGHGPEGGEDHLERLDEAAEKVLFEQADQTCRIHRVIENGETENEVSDPNEDVGKTQG